MRSSIRSFAYLLCVSLTASTGFASTLEDQLSTEAPADLALAAAKEGDAQRGAIVFFQAYLACAKCHPTGEPRAASLGPDLSTLGKDATDAGLVESVLKPSKVIRKGFESVTVATADGKTVAGIVVERTPEKLVLRDAARLGERLTLAAADIDEVKPNPLSLMPAGQVNQLASRQQFLDLIRYLIEVRDGGPSRAKELQPSPTLLTFTLPEYESQLDHAGLIRGWNQDSLKRGEAIYQRVCANCHGTKDRPGSLPTSLRFAAGKFKNGSEPLAMYHTLTRGFGLMAPQTWMVPSQKYDVIHYIRETYLKPQNPSQFVPVDAAYLARLPKGDTRGPEPSKIEPWSAMDYGNSLTHTFEIPGDAPNFAYKGVAVRLDPGAGGVSRGRHWMVFDTDTLRMAAAWSAADKGENFCDWRGIQFNGEHQIHPKIVGRVITANSTGPGWADAAGSFADTQRVEGRDGRRYGPLPKTWGKYHGQYHHGGDVVLAYAIGGVEVLEQPRLIATEDPHTPPAFVRTFNVGPRERELTLQLAEHPGAESAVAAKPSGPVLSLGAAPGKNVPKFAFDGQTYLEVADGAAFDVNSRDFSIAARVKTAQDGTIFALAEPGPKWTPNGQALFIRGGKLAFDIGWVGAVTGRTKVSDGAWHHVAVTWRKSDANLRLYVDGKLDGEGKLAAKAPLSKAVARIGFTSPDFPGQSYFQGQLAEVRFYARRLDEGPREFAEPKNEEGIAARWRPSSASVKSFVDLTGGKHDADVRRSATPETPPLSVGIAPATTPVAWSAAEDALRLKIPAGDAPLKFSIWYTSSAEPVSITEAERDLAPLTHGGPARFPQVLETKAVLGEDRGPFATDILTAPIVNPWLAQLRFSGLDFFADGRIAVCTWDGDVWLVEQSVDQQTLRWRRIATGLFQPLGLKIVDGKIHCICRDQLVVLHDRNGDGETDFYECLNNDAQVTEHFHEFAMGLQTDDSGNFYYAKSGRHALKAIVPQHGTLLKVTRDGSRTQILANGFRAANGVCLNPDGSFVVTDQEGFWNPKNRINWVTLDPTGKPKFYGNLFGYTDVTDESDAAMEPPLCWITNAFDRSPAELLWVTSDKWGPLKGSLLNLSYGYGKVFLVPHERVGGAMQGGMIELPIPTFPTGVMRGRFHPGDGQLYLCGMFAWAGNATQPGGLYRLRATGKPMDLPLELHATKAGLRLTFTSPLEPASLDAKNVQVKTWSLKRTANYGSKHYDEKSLEIRGVSLSPDGKTLTIDAADLRPTWGMELKYSLRSADGRAVSGVIHNTVHELAE